MKMRETSRAQDKKLVVNNNLKKKPKEFLQLEKEFFENAKEKGLSEKLTNYVWYRQVYTQRGYGFDILDPLHRKVA